MSPEWVFGFGVLSLSLALMVVGLSNVGTRLRRLEETAGADTPMWPSSVLLSGDPLPPDISNAAPPSCGNYLIAFVDDEDPGASAFVEVLPAVAARNNSVVGLIVIRTDREASAVPISNLPTHVVTRARYERLELLHSPLVGVVRGGVLTALLRPSLLIDEMSDRIGPYLNVSHVEMLQGGK